MLPEYYYPRRLTLSRPRCSCHFCSSDMTLGLGRNSDVVLLCPSLCPVLQSWSPGGSSLTFGWNPCLAWLLPKGLTSRLWNEGTPCLQGLQPSGNPSPLISPCHAQLMSGHGFWYHLEDPALDSVRFPSGYCTSFPSMEFLLPAVAVPSQKPAISHLLGQLLWQTTPNVSCYHSVAKLCLTLCDLMDCSMTDSSVVFYLLESAQIHVHWVGAAI